MLAILLAPVTPGPMPVIRSESAASISIQPRFVAAESSRHFYQSTPVWRRDVCA